MSTLNEKIMSDIKEAMKAKNQNALTVLRALKSALKYVAIEREGADGELQDADALAVVRKQIKQRQDSVVSFESGGRADLAEKEKAEIEVLERYLPAALSADDIAAMVNEALLELGASSKADMGKVMKLLQERAAGRVDGKTLSQEVMKRLG